MAESEDLMMEEEDVATQIASLQSKSKKLTMMFGVAMLLAVAALGFAFTQSKSLGAEVTAVKAVAERIDSGKEPAIEGIADADQEVGVIHPLGNFVVNLLDPGNLRYVNCRIELEVDDSRTVKEITTREPQFKDAVISLLGNQTYEDVLGVEGKSRLREELLVRFNRLIPDGQIARVYLTEFVVQ